MRGQVLHEGDSGDAVMPALTPGHQAAYREYALDIVQGLAEGPWKYGDVATALTMRAIPTLNGRPNWRPNQVQASDQDWTTSWAKRFEAPERLTLLRNAGRQQRAAMKRMTIQKPRTSHSDAFQIAPEWPLRRFPSAGLVKSARTGAQIGPDGAQERFSRRRI